MSAMQPLLIEIGTEELPVGALPGLAQALFDGVIDGLARRGVAIERRKVAGWHVPAPTSRSSGWISTQPCAAQ